MSWEKVKLGEIATCIQPGPFGSQLHSSDYAEVGTPIIMPKDMLDGKVIYEKLIRVPEEHIQRLKRHQVFEGDIMVARKGDVKKCVYITKKENGWLTGSDCLKVCLDKEKCYPLYVYYQLKSPYVGKCLEQISIGATMPSINTGLLSDIEILLPSLKEQKDIADKLKLYDDLIENNQKQIKLLEEAAQRLYKEWFIDLRFPGYENVKIVDGVPDGWKILKLSEVADVIMGQSPKSEFYNHNKEGLPFHQGVGSYGTRFVVDDTYTTSLTKVADANSILFSVRAPVGRLNITKNKIVIGRGIAAINHKKGYQSFMFYMLKERFFKDDILGNGAVFASISKDELLNQKFVFPVDEQIQGFEKLARIIDKMIENIDRQIKILIEVRNRLLPKLMTGEIEV